VPNVQHKRGTRSALTTLAGSSGLLTGQVYLLTDEDHRPAVAKSSSAFETVALESDFSELFIPNVTKLSSGVTLTGTTFQDVTGLSFPVVDGGTYWFRFWIAYDVSSGTNGTRWSINGPARSWMSVQSRYTISQFAAPQFNGAPIGYDVPATATTTSVGGSSSAVIEGMLLAAADGTLIARAANEEASPSSLTARAGSFVLWKQML
jgi:hypothetical protein